MMTTSIDLAAALEAYIRDEMAHQLEEQVALHLDALKAAAPQGAVEESFWLSTREAASRVGLHEDIVRKASPPQCPPGTQEAPDDAGGVVRGSPKIQPRTSARSAAQSQRSTESGLASAREGRRTPRSP